MAHEDDTAPTTCAAGTSEVVAAPTSSELAVPPSPWLGRIIDDRYRIKELLAEGGMGTVFIAEHLKLRKMVALKTIHPSFLGNEEVAARFAREAMASAQLEHPHVASAMDYGSLSEGGAYLVLELVHGPSLQAHIEKAGAAPLQQVCEIGAQIADALSAAHAMGIVHRDLKPENVLLEARHAGPPIVKVLDFGIARVGTPMVQTGQSGDPTPDLTKMGAVMGTPGYMPPEQAMGAPADERADLYALGVILWEMLAGRCLFDAPSLTGIITQQLAPSASTLAQASVSVSPEFAALLDELLAPEPNDRMQDAGAVRDALRSLAARELARSEEASHLAAPTERSNAAPRLRSALHGVLTASPPRLRAWFANGRQRLACSYSKAAPQLRAWALRAAAFVDTRPRKVVWASFVAAIVVVTSTIMAAMIVEPEEGHSYRAAVKRVEVETVNAPAQVAPPAVPSPKAAAQAQIDVLSRSKSRRERAAAARWLARPPVKVEIPPFAAALARLELATDCRVQTAVLRRLRTLGDPRSLPALDHWYAKPRSGCGLLENRDCFACIRDELNTTHRALNQNGKRALASGSPP
jgi:eukaryotic-like serine/threonine-protein kinase